MEEFEKIENCEGIKKSSILEHHLTILRSNLSIMGNTISSIIDSSEKLCKFKNETAQHGEPENNEPESVVQTLLKHINKIEMYNIKLSLIDSHLKEVI